MHILERKPFLLVISVACLKEELDDTAVDVKIKVNVISFPIKEELHDAAFDVKIGPGMNPLLIKVDGFNVAVIAKKKHTIDRNGSMEEIDIKEEPLQDDLVRECLSKFLNFFLVLHAKQSVLVYMLLYTNGLYYT